MKMYRFKKITSKRCLKLEGICKQRDYSDQAKGTADINGQFHPSQIISHDQKGNNIIDQLTGLYNDAFLYQWANENANKIKLAAVLFIDIDNFKTINQLIGYRTGDLILAKIGQLVSLFVDSKGYAFRYGGKIIVLLPAVGKDEAYHLGEQLRQLVKKNKMLQQESVSFLITISIGVAHCPTDGNDIRYVIEKAERAMYFAKLKGRDQAIYYDPETVGICSCKEQSSQNDLIFSAVHALAAAVDAKDHYTGKHSEMVSKYSLLIADRLGIGDTERDLLRITALLHDCGKIGIPDEIIKKTGKLTQEEWEIITNHPLIGANILSHLRTLMELSPCVAQHHERYDGKGYPFGKVGEEIPLFSRIIAVADSYHAMISDRPYRKGLDLETAISELAKNKGTQFDPAIVDVFVQALRSEESP